GAEGVSEAMLLERAPLLVDAIEAVFADQADSDALNKLVLSAGLDWREVDVIRGYTRYGRQLQIKLAGARVHEILLSRPQLCCDLVSLFHARFDPDLEGDRRARIARFEERVRDALRGIRAHDEDLLFSAILDLITGTLRTNYYRTDRPFHYLSFKF